MISYYPRYTTNCPSKLTQLSTMDDYRRYLPRELRTLLHRYVYGPIIIRHVTGNKENTTLEFTFYMDGTTSTRATMSTSREEIKEFLLLRPRLGRAKERLCIRSSSTTNKLIMTCGCGSMVMELDQSTSELVIGKLERIVREWGKLDGNY